MRATSRPRWSQPRFRTLLFLIISILAIVYTFDRLREASLLQRINGAAFSRPLDLMADRWTQNTAEKALSQSNETSTKLDENTIAHFGSSISRS